MGKINKATVGLIAAAVAGVLGGLLGLEADLVSAIEVVAMAIIAGGIVWLVPNAPS